MDECPAAESHCDAEGRLAICQLDQETGCLQAFSVDCAAEVGAGSQCVPSPDDPNTSGCTPASSTRYDLELVGEMYDDHNGQNIGIVILDGDMGVAWTTTLVESGQWDVEWPGLLVEGRNYTARWYVDVNDNQMCDPESTDVGQEISFQNVTTSLSATVRPSAGPAEVCASFPTPLGYNLTFGGFGYSAYNGKFVTLAVLSDVGSPAFASIPIINGEWDVTFAGYMTQGQSYRVHWYIDANENGTCDAPPTDPVWEDSTSFQNITDHVAVLKPLDMQFTDVCSSF